MRVLVALIIFMSPAMCSAANLLLSEGFEDNSFSDRSWYDSYISSVASSGCYSGNCALLTFNSSGTHPTQLDGAMRKLFTASEELYVTFYINFASGWRGSQQTYHPHMIYLLSDLDNEWAALANNYLDTYIEFLSDVGSPYTVRPSISIQDSLRVNSSIGTPPNDLSATTENRSAAYCNTPASVGAVGDCYNAGAWYSANTWTATGSSVFIGAWHKVEAYFKMNSVSGSVGQSDGIMRMWVDGSQVINHTDVLYRTNQDATKKWHQFVIAPYIGDGSPITQSFYIDSLTVYDGIPSAIIPGLTGVTTSGVTIR